MNKKDGQYIVHLIEGALAYYHLGQIPTLDKIIIKSKPDLYKEP